MTNLKDKKVLVTGSRGFLGRHLVKKLMERGVPPENIFSPGAEELDLRIKKNCEKAVFGRDIVIHLAAVSGNFEFHRNHPAEIFYDNLIMGVSLMEAARAAGVKKFVSIGSVTEYPEFGSLPFKEENIWDGPVEEIHAPYTIAKKMILVQGQAYRAQYDLDAIHLILTNMYGPGEEFERGYVIPSLIKKTLEAKRNNHESIEVLGSGRATRDFLYIDDAAEGVILATEKYDKPEPVNIGSGRETSIEEVARLIAKAAGFSGRIEFNASKSDGRMRSFVDVTRAEKEFGFKAKVSLEEGIRRTVESYGGKSS